VPTPTEKGNIAEAKLAAAAIELGIGVCLPIGDGCRYDLIFDLHPELVRVQAKWAPRKGDILVVGLRTNRCTPRGYVTSVYDRSEVDAFGVYCPDLDRCYLLPIGEFEGQSYTHLRLARARNNQEQGVRMAADYEFGAIAQLGERRAGSAKVAGSSPASSTAKTARPGGLRFFEGGGDGADTVAR
jgi:hypothetical protein